MTPLDIAQHGLSAAAAAAVHAVFLSFAVRLMVEVRPRYGHACAIVVTEYATAGLMVGGLLLGGIGNPTYMMATAAIALLAAGAILIGRTLRFADGERLGIGNGVLIQFMQVPLVLPFIILASFLLDTKS